MSATGTAWYVDLKGPDGNAWVIMGTVCRIIKQCWPGEDGRSKAKTYQDSAMSGDYEHLLKVSNEWVELREKGPDIVLADTPEMDDDERDALIAAAQGGPDATD